MKDTVFPEVTTILLVCGDNSIDVIGFGKLRLVETVRVRRSHHLSHVERWEHEPEADDKRGSHLIFPSSPAGPSALSEAVSRNTSSVPL